MIPQQDTPVIRRFENQQLLLTLLAGFLPTIILSLMLMYAGTSLYLSALIIIALVFIVVCCALMVHKYATWHIGTVSNMMEAMVHGNYSLRAISAAQDDIFGELVQQMNLLAGTLSQQKLKERENQLLLDIIINQMNAALIAVDDDGILFMANRAAGKIFGFSVEATTGKPLSEASHHFLADARHQQVLEVKSGPYSGKYYCFVNRFLVRGKSHRLIMIGDINRLLQQEERVSWQHLLRVLSHEINNSLAPISSISSTLRKSLNGEETTGLTQDMREGLAVIGERAHSLNDFIQRYRQLTQLPEPRKEIIDLNSMISQLQALNPSRTIEYPEKTVEIFADPGQIEQLLLNLIRNADEAMEDEGGKILVQYATQVETLAITIADQGPGVNNPENLFVPFYTTKEKGSGIGLVLARQIAFRHDGNLTLSNRETGSGAIATLFLPHYVPGAVSRANRTC